MSRQLIRNPSNVQRAANVVAVTYVRGLSSSCAGVMHQHADCRYQLQQQQCKLNPNISAAVRRWKSSLHNNNSAPTATASTTTATLCRRSQAEPLNAHGSQSALNASSRNMATKTKEKVLTMKNINQKLVTLEYAVRGPIVIRAGEIEKELKSGAKKPFNEVIRANIGDCHAMGQRPLTYLRQLLALTYEPRLIDSPDYPEDIKERAKELLLAVAGCSMGSYTDSAGIEFVRRQVAHFIEERDGIPSDYLNIYLTGGASPAIKSILSLMDSKEDNMPSGIMVPIPQYPLYSATLAEYGLHKIDYYLDEANNWGLDHDELECAYEKSKKVCKPRAIVLINPGNPTGQVLTRKNIEDVIKFAYEKKLFILADEVYQENVYDKNSQFFSFKKVLSEMGAPYCNHELASFMSVSKGYLGECGIRGGCMEVINMCPEVKAILTKSITASLCSTTAGQVAMSAMVNPPRPGEPSYELFQKEKSAVLVSLKERANLVYDTLSSFEGYTMNPVQGAMYLFPKVDIPKKAIELAKSKKMQPDFFYAFELLEATGICIVPGSGFGQLPGTYHFRSTILPQKDKLMIMMEKFRKFHAEFMNKYK